MGNELKNDVNAIVKIVESMFSPVDVYVKSYDDPERYKITFYFDMIDLRYPYEVRELMMNREIRKYIQNFLGIKTTGLQPPDFYSNEEVYPITTYVKLTE